MRLLLDTSAYSAFMRGHPDIKHVLQQAEAIYFNPIVLGELRAGFRRGRRLEKNEETLGTFMNSPRVHLLSLDEDTSERYAVILNTLWTAGTPIPTNDVWIAASAMQHGLSILTTDAHYQRVPQVLVRYVSTS